MSPGDKNGQCGHGTNNDGVNERTYHGNHTFTNGLIGFGSGMCNRCRTQSGLIREYASLHTNYKYAHNATPANGLGAECTGKNTGQHRRDFPSIRQYNN